MFFLQMSGFPGSGKSTVSKYIERIKGFETILSNSIKYSTIEWTD
ncbi:ATP-binding protein, partial [Bacillus thuringiensis]